MHTPDPYGDSNSSLFSGSVSQWSLGDSDHKSEIYRRKLQRPTLGSNNGSSQCPITAFTMWLFFFFFIGNIEPKIACTVLLKTISKPPSQQTYVVPHDMYVLRGCRLQETDCRYATHIGPLTHLFLLKNWVCVVFLLCLAALMSFLRAFSNLDM